MSYSKSWQYGNNVYVFKLTRNAQVEIERRINNHQLKMASDKDLMEVIPFLEQMESERQEIESMQDGKKKETRLKEFSKVEKHYLYSILC